MPTGFHQVGQAWDGKRGRHCLFLLLAVCGYKASLWASGGDGAQAAVAGVPGH